MTGEETGGGDGGASPRDAEGGGCCRPGVTGREVLWEAMMLSKTSTIGPSLPPNAFHPIE